MNKDQFDKVKAARGFIAALDQSGGSTPKALRLYGIEESSYSTEAEMFDLVHAMRARIMTTPAFSGDRVLGAILFEDTMDRQVDGLATADYLWNRKQVVPFLKVDKGLADAENGAQVMKPIDGLDSLLDRAMEAGIFGTKMRSVVAEADSDGVDAVLDQQFEVGRQIVAKGLVPIIEPEVDINSATKAAAEDLMLVGITKRLDQLSSDEKVMLKLTLPEVTNLYHPLVNHPRVLSVVALSGGYSREVANQRLAQNRGMIASFSRALTEGLTAQMSDAEFDASIGTAIESIYTASIT